MEAQPLNWSALTTDSPGLGIYVGLSRWIEHAVFAKGLSFKQMRVFADGIITVHDPKRAWLLNYFALRDPSMARVVPVQKPCSVEGFRPVDLILRPDHPPERINSYATSGLTAQHSGDEGEMAAFVMTIGLPISQEEEFFGRLLAEHPHSSWDELYGRIAALARRR